MLWQWIGCGMYAVMLFALVATAAGAQPTLAEGDLRDLYLRRLAANGTLRLELRDQVDHPGYAWPRTLLSYAVDFSAADVAADQMELVDTVTGRPQPMQLSDIQALNDRLIFARVNFFSSLLPGESHSFVLRRTRGGPPADAEETVTSEQSGAVIEVDGGTVQVRLPASQAFDTGDLVPGPIMALNRGTGWVGESRIISPCRPIERVDTAVLDAGDLFHRYRVTYRFIDGGRYEVTVKVVAGYPFVEFDEQIESLRLEDEVRLEMAWTGYRPNRRYITGGYGFEEEAWPAIDEPVMTSGVREDPVWDPGTIEDPATRMFFRLSPYQGNVVREAAPAVAFWDDRDGGDELGVFVTDAAGWEDHQYMVWQPSDRLSVWFRYDGGTLYWNWPLVSGTRQTGISLHDAAAGQAAVQETLETLAPFTGERANLRYDVRHARLRYNQLLRSRYGALSLDRVKDWVLEYPEAGAQPDDLLNGHSPITSADAYVEALFNSIFVFYPLGLNVDPGIHNIYHRDVYDWIVPGYLKFRQAMAPAQRRRVTALLLLSAYVTSSEEMVALRTSISGTPNMSADGWMVPTQMAMLFPDHPMAREWRDQFEKAVELTGLFYTRPDVPAFDAIGGRWAESPGVYTWAYLRPVSVSDLAGVVADGRTRMTNPSMSLLGKWLVGSLSAPIYNPKPFWRQQDLLRQGPEPLDPDWEPGMPLSREHGLVRQYPAHGAHGSGTGLPVPPVVWIIGQRLRQYDPLLAEHLMWAYDRNQTGEGIEDPDAWYRAAISRLPANRGTNPHLGSAKFTGQGVVLRAGVGTPEELSVHLQQIDRGPNYRWGNMGEGAAGTIYFFAGGRIHSAHERENTGDHALEDVVGLTNFGVMKEGAYRSIGMNVLEEPLHDLDVAQFSEITSRRGDSAYSWPVYKSRSVMVVGTDYMVLFDELGTTGRNSTRFSWFTAKDLPMPKLVFLQPMSIRADHWTQVRTAMSKGFLRDASGPSLVLVTHKGDAVEMEGMTSQREPHVEGFGLRRYRWARGGKLGEGIYRARTPTSRDRFFRHETTIDYEGNGESFTGRAGLIRSREDGMTELALFRGSRIGAAGLALRADADAVLGIAARYGEPSRVEGTCHAPAGPVSLAVEADESELKGVKFYVDGAAIEARREQGRLIVHLPRGRHRWEMTSGLPRPVRPIVQRTENAAGGAVVFFTPVAGADRYRVELSRDGGSTWARAGETEASPYRLEGLPNGRKVHVRIVAMNAERESEPSREYPVYLTDEVPVPPDGLRLVLGDDHVKMTWGQVLGVTAYRLYRQRDYGPWELIYDGPERSFIDVGLEGVRPPLRLPGVADNVMWDPAAAPIYRYAVAAVNGNGEGARGEFETTDPRSWRNWWPDNQPRRFRRQTAYYVPPYVPRAMTPPMYYPQDVALKENE